MQFIVISHQLWEICVSFLLGIFLGFVYDFCRFIRTFLAPIDKKLILCNIIDVLFFIFAGISYCILIYSVSSGRFRWFTAFGLFAGALLYRLLPSRIIFPILKWFAGILIRLLKCLVFPFRAFIRLISRAAKTLLCGIKRKSLIDKTNKFKAELYSDVQFKSIG